MSKIKVRFVVWNARGSSFHVKAVRSIYRWYEARGHDVGYIDYRNWNAKKIYDSGADRVYLWNGEYTWLRSIRGWCRDNGVDYRFIEVAWFPQGENIYVDSKGTNGNCSLHLDDLSWLEKADFDRLDAISEVYREGITPSEDGYILIPLQLSQDTTIQKWSPLKRNGDIVRAAQSMFPGRQLVFRRHPKDGKPYDDLGIDIAAGSSRPLKEMIMGADLVWGMNSTVLTEAALMGKPVIAAGKSFLNIGQNRREALAALVARQIPIGVEDIAPWVRPGRGLHHLSNLIT